MCELCFQGSKGYIILQYFTTPYSFVMVLYTRCNVTTNKLFFIITNSSALVLIGHLNYQCNFVALYDTVLNVVAPI